MKESRKNSLCVEIKSPPLFTVLFPGYNSFVMNKSIRNLFTYSDAKRIISEKEVLFIIFNGDENV